jgi:hypothetical protein
MFTSKFPQKHGKREVKANFTQRYSLLSVKNKEILSVTQNLFVFITSISSHTPARARSLPLFPRGRSFS